MVFLSHITGKRAQRKADGRWEMPIAEVVREAAGTQSDMTYICIRQVWWHSGWRCGRFLRCEQERRGMMG